MKMKRFLSLLLTFAMVIGMLPMNALPVFAVEETEHNHEEGVSVTCTCGTDDESIHATNCPAYVAPETAVCTCVEQCTEDNANVWCDVCGFDASACTGTDTAVTYDDTVTVLDGKVTITDGAGLISVDGDVVTISVPEAGYFITPQNSVSVTNTSGSAAELYFEYVCIGRDLTIDDESCDAFGSYSKLLKNDESISISFTVADLELDSFALTPCAHTTSDGASAWTDGTCSVCGEEHEHASTDWSDGVCATCGAEHTPHAYNENGFCTCGGYQAAVAVTAENYKDLGFTAENYEGYLGYYAISNAGQLYWFADKVNNDNGNYGSANAVLTANITVNSGYAYTFRPDTCLVEITKDSKTVAYIGTGVKGDTSGTNTVFDTTASTIGAVYKDTADATADTVDLSDIRPWTPIGNYTNQYSGTFDGNSKTVSGLYFNNTRKNYVGLIGYSTGTVKKVGVAASFMCGGYSVGGVVGQAVHAKVENCYNTGSVSGTYAVGGVVGYSTIDNNRRSQVENCYNTGTVTCSNRNVGGVLGHNTYCMLTNCYYLTGCARDGNGTIQNGIGADTLGSTTADVEGQTAVKTKDEFGNGTVAYLLNGESPPASGSRPWAITATLPRTLPAARFTMAIPPA